MSGSARLAAIDIGTVTTRLLVADVGPAGVSEVERSTDITHLGSGLTSTGRLSADGMERVARVVGRYVERIEELGVAGYAAVATSASRDAENGPDLIRMLAERGLHVQVIDGQTEAELAFSGAVWGLQGDGILVVDVGGGSTEVVLGAAGATGPRIDASRSVDVGSRRMTERFFRRDPPTEAELDEARRWAKYEFRAFFDRLASRPREMVALAGTATTLAAVLAGMTEYDSAAVHGSEVTGSDVADLLERFVSVGIDERRLIKGLHPERAGVIVAGTLVLETVLALAGLDRFTVSEHDILYGILLSTYRDLREPGQ